MNTKLERRLVELEKRAPSTSHERVTVELCGFGHSGQIVARAVWDDGLSCFVPIDAELTA